MPASERTAHPLKPLLRPRHFEGLDTRLTPHGLAGEFYVGDPERSLAVLSFETRDTEAFLGEIALRREATRIVLHPDELPAPELHKRMSEADALAGHRDVRPGYGLPRGAYDTCWEVERECPPDGPGERLEGQQLVAVAFDADTPVGFCTWEADLFQQPAQREYSLILSLKLVYVDPQRRGEGFGLDLSITCGTICSDLLRAAYMAVPAHTTLDAHICADYESAGGEAFSLQVCQSLEIAADTLPAFRRLRPNVSFDEVILDAGY